MFTVKAGNLVINDPTGESGNLITGKVTKAVNSVDNFSFRIYPNNAGYNALEAMVTHIDVTDEITGNKDVFHGRVLTINAGMDSSGNVWKDVVCEGELAYLCDSFITYSAPSTSVPAAAIIKNVLDLHNEQVDESRQILLGQTGELWRTFSGLTWGYTSGYEAIRNTILGNEEIGGEIRLRYSGGKRYLDYTYSTFTDGSGMRIELGVNMQAATLVTDPSAITTRLYPLGAKLADSEKRLMLSGEYIEDSALVEKYGVIAHTVIFDNAETEAELQEYAKIWLEKQQPVKKQYTVSVADLSLINTDYEAFKVGTQYHIYNPLIGLDDIIRCIGMEICIEDRVKTVLTFGDKFETATSQAVQREINLNRKVVEIEKNTSPLIKQIVYNQTEILKGAEGGYIYYKTNSAGEPQEIFFLNSPDITTATSTIRINRNGIGFWKSSDGGTAEEGPYTSAWTIDGTFNTAYIVAQVLTGLQINNGNGTFKVDSAGNVTANSLNSTNATITGGSINISSSSETTSIIRLNSGDWHMLLSPLELRLKNDSIGGNFAVQAGALFGFWYDEQKIAIYAGTGNIVTQGGGEYSFVLDTNNRNVRLYHIDDGVLSIELDGANGLVKVYDSNGHSAIWLDGNNRAVSVRDSYGSEKALFSCNNYGYAHFVDSSGQVTVVIDGEQGTIRAPGGVITS